MLKIPVAVALLRLNGGYSAEMILVRMKVKIKRTLKTDRAPRMKNTKVTIRKIVTMKAESLLKQDSSLLKQDSMVDRMTMTQICLKMMMERNRIEDIAQIKLNDNQEQRCKA